MDDIHIFIIWTIADKQRFEGNLEEKQVSEKLNIGLVLYLKPTSSWPDREHPQLKAAKTCLRENLSIKS